MGRKSIVAPLVAVLVCVACGLAGNEAEAGPLVYDNGAPNGEFEGVDVSYLLADDFILSVDTIITGILGWTGDSWMILEGETAPDVLIADGSFADPIHVSLSGGKRYWLGVVTNGSIHDACSASASAAQTDRNGSLPAHYLSYVYGPVGVGSPLCESGVPPPPYDFSSPFWGLDHFAIEEDFSFQLVGVEVPEPSAVLLVGAGALGALLRRRCVCR